MRDTSPLRIDGNVGGLLSQIADQIDKPLQEIIRLLEYLSQKELEQEQGKGSVSHIMLQSSEQIQRLIADIRQLEQQKQVLVRLNRVFKFPTLYTLFIDDIPQSEQEWLLQLEDLVVANLCNSDPKLGWLATEMITSERNLFRKIKKFTGQTPNNYIRSIRLLMAKKLLEEQVCSTTYEAAQAVGFSDPHYFAKLFEKHFGMKPKDYPSGKKAEDIMFLFS
jgi:AraC-like DNA-binding protein